MNKALPRGWCGRCSGPVRRPTASRPTQAPQGFRFPVEAAFLDDALRWWCVGDRTRVGELLELVTHIGRRRAVGRARSARERRAVRSRGATASPCSGPRARCSGTSPHDTEGVGEHVPRIRVRDLPSRAGCAREDSILAPAPGGRADALGLAGASAVDRSPPPGARARSTRTSAAWPITIESTRALHRLVTAISGLPHHPPCPPSSWRRGPTDSGGPPGDRRGRPSDGREDAHRSAPVRAPVQRPLRSADAAPLPGRQRRRSAELRVRTLTPLVVRGNGRVNDGGRARAQAGAGAPTDARRTGLLTSTLSAWLPRRVGLLRPDVLRTGS